MIVSLNHISFRASSLTSNDIFYRISDNDQLLFPYSNDENSRRSPLATLFFYGRVEGGGDSVDEDVQIEKVYGIPYSRIISALSFSGEYCSFCHTKWLLFTYLNLKWDEIEKEIGVVFRSLLAIRIFRSMI